MGPGCNRLHCKDAWHLDLEGRDGRRSSFQDKVRMKRIRRKALRQRDHSNE
jgi:hypothetical protein